MPKARIHDAAVRVRLPLSELRRLEAFAVARNKTVSQVMREAIGWMVHVPDVTRAMGVAAVTAAMTGPAPKGLFRLGEDRRIKHLDEGSPLEGMDAEGRG